MLQAALRITGLYARGVRNALRHKVTTVVLDFDDLPQDFDGFRILHLSDLHIDCLEGMDRAVAAMLRDIPADLCVMTGDYRFAIEGGCEQVRAGMETVLNAVTAKHGVVGLLGNHDPCEIAYALEHSGVQMLINEAAEITNGSASIWFAGVDDSYDYRCDDLDLALSGIPPDAFKILLAHTPDLYHDASNNGVRLYLCGHTHAGQVRLPLIGSVVQNSDAPRAYTYGLWRHREMHGYTSAGVGCSMLPIRFNCPPEIVLIELRRSA